jgi:addiction module RelE/StbE family toxin
MVEIKWLIEAQEDLREIYDYISKDSERYANRQIERIFDRVQGIKEQIRSGKIVEEISDKTIREIIEGRYRIIYRIINENLIHILMIHHSSRDLQKRIK